MLKLSKLPAYIKKMNKRGQFFLIAAVVVVGVLVSLATVQNTILVTKEDITVFDLTEEINFEGSQVIVSGVMAGKEELEIQEDLIKLTKYYAEENPDKEIITVFGNDAGLIFKGVEFTCTKDPSINHQQESTSQQEKDLECGREEKIIEASQVDFEEVDESKIILTLNNKEKHRFNIRHGERFFVIIKKEKGKEIFLGKTGELNNRVSSIKEEGS